MPFSESKIIALYCIVDDMLTALGHNEDSRVSVKDSEIITTAFVSVLYFGGHMDNARIFMKMKGYVPRMLDKSRFCRRLHRRSELLITLFSVLGRNLKHMAGAATYVLDSFPVAVCDNIRISRCRILDEGEKLWRGRHAAMRRYFFGVRVQVLTLEGMPVEFCITPGRENDSVALGRLPLEVAPESCIYADAGYTNYDFEDMMAEDGIWMMVQRRGNSTRKDEPWISYIKEQMRKGIETTFSELTARMPRRIHAVTKEGFMLKITLLIIAYTFELITP
jgi:DDE family transposase